MPPPGRTSPWDHHVVAQRNDAEPSIPALERPSPLHQRQRVATGAESVIFFLDRKVIPLAQVTAALTLASLTYPPPPPSSSVPSTQPTAAPTLASLTFLPHPPSLSHPHRPPRHRHWHRWIAAGGWGSGRRKRAADQPGLGGRHAGAGKREKQRRENPQADSCTDRCPPLRGKRRGRLLEGPGACARNGGQPHTSVCTVRVVDRAADGAAAAARRQGAPGDV
mmetsp:Transcript_17018/g.51023  ORF Transcript_17018/g.51023 Transcript_17018/m.51023 type:complete len:222 (+) Transcript_17018:265-930(+)